MSEEFKVVIVGRPNTGKSTLFNALAKKKISIVDDTPGVTRDYLQQTITFKNKSFSIYDSGGLFNPEEDHLNDIVHNKSIEIIDQADLILFLCDIREVTPIDEDIAQLLRKKQFEKTILVLNKADRYPQYDYSVELADFYSFGFSEHLILSSAHRIGFKDLLANIIEKVPEKGSQQKADKNTIITTIVGKPNVGKSSLLNKLAGKDLSIVYDEPGTTRDTVDFELTYHDQNIRIIDTAGIRKKSKVNEDIEYYSVNRAIKSIKRSTITILVIDAVAGITDQDKKIISLVIEYNKALLLVVNKWDLIDKEQTSFSKYIRDLRDNIPQLEFIPILTISALTGQRVRKILDETLRIHENYYRRIETSEFNKFIKEIVMKKDISAKVKIYYGMQVRSGPPIFQIFVNHEKNLRQNKRLFISNLIYQNFNFDGVFIILQVKSSKGVKK